MVSYGKIFDVSIRLMLLVQSWKLMVQTIEINIPGYKIIWSIKKKNCDYNHKGYSIFFYERSVLNSKHLEPINHVYLWWVGLPQTDVWLPK